MKMIPFSPWVGAEATGFYVDENNDLFAEGHVSGITTIIYKGKKTVYAVVHMPMVDNAVSFISAGTIEEMIATRWPNASNEAKSIIMDLWPLVGQGPDVTEEDFRAHLAKLGSLKERVGQ